MRKSAFTIVDPHLFPSISELSKESNSHITTFRLNVQEMLRTNPILFFDFQ